MCCLAPDPDLFPLLLRAYTRKTYGGGHKAHVTHMTVKQQQVLTAIKEGQIKYHRGTEKKESSVSLRVEAGEAGES